MNQNKKRVFVVRKISKELNLNQNFIRACFYLLIKDNILIEKFDVDARKKVYKFREKRDWFDEIF